MQNHVSAVVAQILAFASAADQVLILGFPSKVQIATATGLDGNEVLFFEWYNKNGQEMSTKLTEEGISAGHWVGGKFVCQDFEGDLVHLHFSKSMLLQPDVQVRTGASFEQYKPVLIAGLKELNRESHGNHAQQQVLADELVSLLCGNDVDLFGTLFPTQYAAMLAIHELNVVSATDMGYDWDTLTPALTAVSVALGYVDGDAAESRLLEEEGQPDGEPSESDVAEWVGLHYGRNYDAEPAEKKAEWIERYKEAHQPGDDANASVHG